MHLCCAPPGTGSGTFTLTFVNSSNVDTAVKLECMGEATFAAVANGDAVATIATAVRDAINQQTHWPVSASAALGVVTVTSKTAGLRHDHHLNRFRASFTKPQAGGGTTLAKSAVTPASTEDDLDALCIRTS